MSQVEHALGDGAVVDPERSAASRWYACATLARREKQVEEWLRQRGVESFLPLHSKERRWKDRKTLVPWPLFPGYVFGRFTLDQLPGVISLPGVSTVVRQGGRPAPIPDQEIENVRLFAEALSRTGVQPELVCHVRVGQRVKVISGDFAGIEGKVREIRGRKRLYVGVSIIPLGWRIKLPAEVLVPLDEPA